MTDPARNFDDHVEDRALLVGEEGNVVEGREDGAVLFEVDAVLWGA